MWVPFAPSADIKHNTKQNANSAIVKKNNWLQSDLFSKHHDKIIGFEFCCPFFEYW